MSRIRIAAMLGVLASTYTFFQVLPVSTSRGEDFSDDAQTHDVAVQSPIEERLDRIQTRQGEIVDELQELRRGQDPVIYSTSPIGREELTPENVDQLRLLATIDQFAYEVAWKDDGSEFALVPWEGRVELRDAASLEPVSTIPFGPMTIHFAFSPIPGLVALSENDESGIVQLIDLQQGTTTPLDVGGSQSRAVFSPDGSLIATGRYGSARVWRVSDGELLHTLYMGPKEGGLTPVFSPNGEVIAVGNRNSTTRLFNAHTGELIHELHGKVMSKGLAFRPQGDILAVGYVGGSIGLWDVEHGELLLEHQTDAEEIYRVAWSPSGEMLASAGLFSEITFWSIPDFEPIHTLPTPEWVISLTFSPDGKTLVTSGGPQRNQLDCEVSFWGIPVE